MLGLLNDKTTDGIARYLEQFIEVFRNHNHNNDNTPGVDKKQNGIGLSAASGIINIGDLGAGDVRIVVGFKPKYIRFNGYSHDLTTYSGASWGAYTEKKLLLIDGSGQTEYANNTCFYSGYDNTAHPFISGDGHYIANYCFYIPDDGNFGNSVGVVTATDNESFTLTISYPNGAPNVAQYANWEALG